MIDIDTLRSLLHYDPDTGIFTWRVTRGGTAWAGREAGCARVDGYRCVFVKGINYKAHRVAWFYVHGVWPPQHLDHINGVRSDNRIVNLRLASVSQNAANRVKSIGSLPKGVRRHRNRFVAQICRDGKRRHIGVFDTPEQAHAAYCEAAQQAFGAYHRAG